MKEWHQLVLERDNYTCQSCKEYFGYGCYFDDKGVNQYLTGHHIKTKGSHPELKYDVSNGVTLCEKCHREVHSGVQNCP